MKFRSVHGVMVAGAVVALVAGCSGGGGEVSRSAPAPVAPAPSAATSAPAQSAAAVKVDPVTSTTPTARPAPPKPERPVIGRVWTTPQLPCDGDWCTLSPPAGTVTFHAQVSGATRVEFLLVPTGTGTAGHGRPIGVDRNGRDGWTAGYSYADEPLSSHLSVVARGPGGTAETLPFNVYHP